MTIPELNTKIQAFDLNAELGKIIQKNEKAIVEYNTEQLYAGFDSKGQNLSPEYTKKTIGIKQKKSPPQPTDRVTLKDTGDFYKGFKIEAKQNDFEIISTDEKAQGLKSKYGADIFGLAPEDRATVTDKILNPQLTQALNEIL